MGFTGTTPDNELGWVICNRLSVQKTIDDAFPDPEHKMMGVEAVNGVDVTVVAPTTPSGRAQAGVRLYLIELDKEVTLFVAGGGTAFAKSLAEQWGAN